MEYYSAIKGMDNWCMYWAQLFLISPFIMLREKKSQKVMYCMIPVYNILEMTEVERMISDCLGEGWVWGCGCACRNIMKEFVFILCSPNCSLDCSCRYIGLYMESTPRIKFQRRIMHTHVSTHTCTHIDKECM